MCGIPGLSQHMGGGDRTWRSLEPKKLSEIDTGRTPDQPIISARKDAQTRNVHILTMVAEK